MNDRDLAELRRRYRHDKSNITHVRGCFVNEKKEIISEFDQSLGLLQEDEADAILKVLKKALSGSIGRNLVPVEFSTAQVMESEEHRLLTTLRASGTKDDETVHAFFEKIIGSLEIEGNYVILLATERFDVASFGADGERREESTEFSYVISCICPIKSGRAAMSYYFPGNCFRSVCADMMLSAPELGVVFPTMEDGGANLYGALYYAKDAKNNHPEVMEALLGVTKAPLPISLQKAAFGDALTEAMGEDCSLKIVRAVHTQLRGLLEAEREEPTEEPLLVSRDGAASMLRACGVPEERVTAFEEKFSEELGEDAVLHPKTVADTAQLRVKTAEVSVTVKSGHGDLVETRVIDGVRYVMIRAEGDVEVNGVRIQI